MKKKDFLKVLEAHLEMNEGSIKGDEKLSALEAWDSLAVVGFIALADKLFNLEVPAHVVTSAETIGDLIGLLGSHIEG